MPEARYRHILAVDLGEKRIGLAVSDPTGVLASALMVLNSQGRAKDVLAVLQAARSEGVEAVLVGVPVSMSGEHGPMAEKSRRFGELLAERSGLPVLYWDERLTTVEANRYLRDAGMRAVKRRRTIDAHAAALLLQGYLDYVKSS